MTEISRGRSDEFGDFMTVLKLPAIDLNDGARIAEKRLAVASTARVLPVPSRPEEQEVSNPAGRPARARRDKSDKSERSRGLPLPAYDETMKFLSQDPWLSFQSRWHPATLVPSGSPEVRELIRLLMATKSFMS